MKATELPGNPIVSVILPVYNTERYIKDAVFSILNQTFSSLELIIVDDFSSDNTLKVVGEFSDDRLKVISLKENKGYPFAMNTGIEASTGHYIARMDADDVSAPKRIHEQVKALTIHPEASFCGVARYRITPGGKMYADKAVPDRYYKKETWQDLFCGSRIFTDPSVMAAKEKILAVGGYRTFQRSGMDVDLWFRLMERYGDCVTITFPLFGKRLEPGSIIFKTETALINQIPRVLAEQRKHTGIDDVQKTGKPDIEKYKRDGKIRLPAKSDHFSIQLGACASCLMLHDWNGALVYWKILKQKSRDAGVSRWSILNAIWKKIRQRVLNNPHKRFSPNW